MGNQKHQRAWLDDNSSITWAVMHKWMHPKWQRMSLFSNLTSWILALGEKVWVNRMYRTFSWGYCCKLSKLYIAHLSGPCSHHSLCIFCLFLQKSEWSWLRLFVLHGNDMVTCRWKINNSDSTTERDFPSKGDPRVKESIKSPRPSADFPVTPGEPRNIVAQVRKNP